MNEAGDGTVVAAGPAVGGRLAEARQAQSLTAAEVARQLKLSVWQVEALEAGRFEQLPGPVFVRGFIRNYARLLRLDPNELLREAGGSVTQPVTPAAVAPSPEIPFPAAGKSRWPMLAAAVATIVAALAAYEFLWNEPASRPAPPVTAAKPAVQPEQPPAAVTDAAPAAPATDAPATPSSSIASAAASPAAQNAPAAATDDKQPESEKELRPGERQVRLAFEQESWVEIRDRNERVIFSQLNPAGTQQLINGLPPFSVIVGNAHGVRMTYDDKPVDLASHTKIDVARLILQ